MFASERQRLAVCAALLRPLDLVERGYWGLNGPTPPTIDLIEGRGCGLSSGEQIVLRVAMDIWNGFGGAKLDDVLGRLDNPNLRRIGTLFVAMADGDEAVEQWLDTQARRRR